MSAANSYPSAGCGAPARLSAVPDRRPARYAFGFGEFHERTAHLDGPTRADVFAELPEMLQHEAWSGLREHRDLVTELDYRDYRDEL